MDNLEYFKKIKEFNQKTLNVNAQCRTAKALEIIAETLISIDKRLCTGNSLARLKL